MRRPTIIRALTAIVLGPVLAYVLLVVGFVGFVVVHGWGSGRFWNFADEAEAFLLPEGFRGRATLVFGDSTAPPTPRLGRARLYDFRGGPVLRVRETAPSGHRTPDWYFVDSRGRRRHFLRGDRCDDRDAGLRVCRSPGQGVLMHPGEPHYEYETWTVGRERSEVAGVVNDPSRLVHAQVSGARRPR